MLNGEGTWQPDGETLGLDPWGQIKKAELEVLVEPC